MNDLLVEFSVEKSQTGVFVHVVKREIMRMFPRQRIELWRFRLRQENKSPVVTEVRRHQLRVVVQSQSLFDEPVEMPDEKIGQVKRTRLRVAQLFERNRSGKKFVAMYAGQSLDTKLRQRLIQ